MGAKRAIYHKIIRYSNRTPIRRLTQLYFCYLIAARPIGSHFKYLYIDIAPNTSVRPFSCGGAPENNEFQPTAPTNGPSIDQKKTSVFQFRYLKVQSIEIPSISRHIAIPAISGICSLLHSGFNYAAHRNHYQDISIIKYLETVFAIRQTTSRPLDICT